MTSIRFLCSLYQSLTKWHVEMYSQVDPVLEAEASKEV